MHQISKEQALLKQAISIVGHDVKHSTEQGRFLVNALNSVMDTEHSEQQFVYVGWRSEHLPTFSECETFWLSPQKIMSLEQYGGCSSRNRELIRLWVATYGLYKEVQVNLDPTTGWCSLMD